MPHDEDPEPDGDAPDAPETPPPPPPPADPFERARAAIRASKEARGIDPDAPSEDDLPVSRDPESVLQRAAAARAQAAVGRKGLEREARAREELARLKGGGSLVPPKDPPVPGDDPAPPANEPRKRRL